LDFIEGPSEGIFAFVNKVTLSANVQSIRPDAKFLFSKLSRLNIEVLEDCKDINIEQMINEFRHEGDCQARLLFIKVKLSCYESRVNFLGPAVRPRINKLCIKSLYQDQFDHLLLIPNENSNNPSASSLWPELTELTLSNIGTVSLDRISFNLFPKLQKVVVNSQDPIKLEENTLRQAPNLVELDLSNTLLVHLSPDFFCGLQKLRVLKLGYMIINYFEVFNCLVNLEDLMVSVDCTLMAKRLDKFARLPKLTKLNLEINNVERIDPDAFDHLTNIDSFDIWCHDKQTETFETGLVPSIFSVFSHFETLKINSKTVSRIANIEAFGLYIDNRINIVSSMPLTGLKELVISPANQMSFLQMTNLEHLILHLANDFSFLDNGRLACLSNLKSLELRGSRSYSPFARLNAEFFTGLTSLNRLSINSWYWLTRIESGTFKHLTKLLELNLDNNSIETIEPGTFAHLLELKVLSMSSNELTQFPSYCFQELPNLEELTLVNNLIESVPLTSTLPNDERVANTRIIVEIK
jgi:Leucine-rich repeat (LRR) protein